MLRGTCDRAGLLDLVENFTLCSEKKAGLEKIIGQNHQVLGVNNTLASMLGAREQGHGRGGVVWQTQGSGKSYSMVFFAQKVLRKVPGNWTFVIGTDRVELDCVGAAWGGEGSGSFRGGDSLSPRCLWRRAVATPMGCAMVPFFRSDAWRGGGKR